MNIGTAASAKNADKFVCRELRPPIFCAMERKRENRFFSDYFARDGDDR